jgi:hypothetical protein
LLLDALEELGRHPDFLIFVDEHPAPVMRLRPPDSDLIDRRKFSLGNQAAAYSAAALWKGVYPRGDWQTKLRRAFRRVE